MLAQQLGRRALKGRLATQPFIHHHSKGVLVALQTGRTTNLLRGHVDQGAIHFRNMQRVRCGNQQGDAKIAEQDPLILSQEQILRFEIAMDQPLVMGILQGRSDIRDIADDGLEGNPAAARMAFAQSPTRRVLHHQIGHFLRKTKVENANNMRVIQVAQLTGFNEKVPHCIRGQMGVEHFDGNQRVEVDLFRQVHIGKAT